MNVAPSAASSIGAPAAGVVPGVTAGVTPAHAPSFADLLRTLAGQEAGAATTENASVSAAALLGVPARAGKGASAESDAATTEGAASGDDAALLTGAFGVPVALTLPVPAQPVATPPEGSSAGTTIDGDVAASYQSGGATAAPLTTPAAMPAAPAATIAAPIATTSEPGPTAPTFTSTGATAPDQIADAPGASVMAPPTTVPGAAAHVGAPAGRGTDSADASAIADVTADRSTGHTRQGRRNDDGAVTAAATGDGSATLAPGLTSASGSEPADQAATDVAKTETPTAATIATATATATQATANPAPGLPRALARVLEQGGAGRAREHGAPATTAAAASASPIIDAAALAALANAGGDMAGGEQAAEDSDGAADGSPAPGRATAHPALAAALRAFQQAAAPAAASTATPQGEGETRLPITAARIAAAFAAADPAAAIVEGDRRPATLTTLLTPLMSVEPKLASEWASAVKAEATAASVLTSADAEAVHSQVVQSLKLQWAGGAGEATVRLRPEYLGDVTATIKVEQGAVTATLQADRPEVRRWMEANTQTLRDGLVEHGLKLDRLDILAEAAKGGATHDERQGKPRGRQPQQQPPQPRPRRERQDDDAPAFAVNP